MTKQNKNWWKEAIIYQIYPRSYCDGNGDGIGDLRGIIKKLDYLKELGITMIWISPIFSSPNADNGYDISDFYQIMDEFGTMDDFDLLLAESKKRGIRLLLDIVLNHTSDEHPWFLESRSSRTNSYRDFYIWRDGVGDGPPNNWSSIFEGSAWKYDKKTKQYYLHYFLDKQPDVNWESTRLKQALCDALKFWLDKGIDEFRLDVIPFISKRLDFPDTPHSRISETINNVYANGPKIHDHLKYLYQNVWQHYDCFTMGEGVGISLDEVNDYVAENRQEINAIYHFDHFGLDDGPGGRFDPIPIDYEKFKSIFFTWDQALSEDAWGLIYLGNHDLGRMVNRFGSIQFPKQSAKCLLSIILTMRGTPILYMGDEIGMTNTVFDSIDEVDDIMTVNAYHTHTSNGGNPESFMKAANLTSRDHSRTPMHWSSAKFAGFSSSEPWIRMNPNWKIINVETQLSDPNSVLQYCKDLINFRKENQALTLGKLVPVQTKTATIFAYYRSGMNGDLLIIHNLSDAEDQYLLPHDSWCSLEISNDQVSFDRMTVKLKPWQSIILSNKKDQEL